MELPPPLTPRASTTRDRARKTPAPAMAVAVTLGGILLGSSAVTTLTDSSCSKASITPSAEPNRSSLSFSRQWYTTVLSHRGMSRSWEKGGTASSTCCRYTSPIPSPWKGGNPVSSSYSTIPKE